MSYNIDSCEYLDGYVKINRRTAWALLNANCPEDNFLENVHGEADEVVRIIRPSWCGEGSGCTYEEYKKALSRTTGCADILITWEGGYSHTGLRVVDGVVTEKKVKMVLVD